MINHHHIIAEKFAGIKEKLKILYILHIFLRKYIAKKEKNMVVLLWTVREYFWRQMEERRVVLSMKCIYTGGEGEITEKKSRFIATVRPVATEEEAAAFIAEMKKKYWDARHNCSAFVIGGRQEVSRCSDDGEPAQTAGRPMLDVLLREDIHNVAVVVTRYFGGVLLGTGGLVRAYQKAVQEGLAASVIIDKKEGRYLSVGTDYNGLGKLQYLIAQKDLTLIDTLYTEKVELKLMVPVEVCGETEKEITETTSGTARISWGEQVLYAMVGKKLEIF